MDDCVQIELPQIHQDIILDEHRYKVIKAGRGFAKSGILLAETIMDLEIEYSHPTGQYAKNRIVYGAPTYKEGREIIWERAKEQLEPFTDGRPNESRLEIPLINEGIFIIKGCDKPDSLRGPYMTKFLGDEFAFHKEGYLMKIVRPQLGKVRPFGRVALASTPDGFDEFEEFYQRGQSNDPQWSEWASWQYSSIEGGFMDPQEVEDGKKEMTWEQWRQEYWAETLMPTNSVYFKFNRAKHCRKINHVPDLTIHWSWDFNVNPAVHSTLSHHHKGKSFAFDEICVGNTPNNIDEFCDRYPKDKVSEIKLYGDYNGTYSTNGTTDFLEMQKTLSQRGYPFPELCVYGGNPIVRSRTNNYNRLLEDASGDIRYYVDPDKCPRLVRDLEQVRWSLKSADIDKGTDPTLTHISDGEGYRLWVMDPPEWATKSGKRETTRPRDEKSWWT